jgi:AcrR family transcriptional regulator
VGRTAQISRTDVLAAALELADEAGLESVTMHAVGRRLAVTPMALYRHVGGKDAVLDGLVETLLTEVTETAAAAPARGAPLTPGEARPAVTAAARAARDAVYLGLREAGLPAESVARAERLVSTAILGFAASEAAGRFAGHDEAVLDADFAELLRWLWLALTTSQAVGARPVMPPGVG